MAKHDLRAGIAATPRGPAYGISTAPTVPELPERAGALPGRLQDIARSYLGARRQSGVSLLEAARWLSEARTEAKHGEWAIFLEAIGLDESRARAQIRIHEEAQRDPVFADRIVNGFLSETVARDLLPASPEVRAEVLSRETPPTLQDVREAKRASTPVLEPTIPIPPDDLRAAGVGLTRHGSWWIAVGYSGEMNNWTSGNAQPWDLAVAAAREEIARRTATPPPAEPDLADILLRLDAHGYAKIGTRQKGITTFYSFRDYRNNLDDGSAGEIELAEGELPIWLAELDSNAAYAQAKQERYLDAQARAEALGYDLRRDGTQFVLTPAGQRVPALVGTLDAQIKTIEGYEKNAAKKSAAAAPAPTGVPTLAELDELGMPVDLHNAGYYWHSATPPTVAQNGSAWRGEAPTVEGALELARLRKDSKGEPITVFPALNPMECKALLREAKLFISSGLDRKLPTIGQALRIAARMALEATEDEGR